jgi:PAS domain S-box-containing protein
MKLFSPSQERRELARDAVSMRRGDMETTSTRWLAHVIAAAGDGVVVTDEDGRIILFNAAAEDLFGYPAEEVLGRRVEVLLPKRDRRAHREWVRSLLETRKPARRAIGQLREIVALRKGRVEAPVEVMLSRASFGNTAMLVALVRDVSERKKAEEQQRLLTAELSQRVRNILAVVQSIAAQGLRTSSSPEHFVKAFNGRLTALARAHDLLARKEEGIRLDVLIAEQVRPGAPGEEERIAIHGPPVALLPESALSLALTFHELATNAAKHGALSVPEGHVEIEWWREERWDDRYLVLEWRELDAPRCSGPRRAVSGAGSSSTAWHTSLAVLPDWSSGPRASAAGSSFRSMPTPRDLSWINWRAARLRYLR